MIEIQVLSKWQGLEVFLVVRTSERKITWGGEVTRHSLRFRPRSGTDRSIARIAQMVNFAHIKQHYYEHAFFGPTGIVPLGPIIDFTTSHGREKMTGQNL